MSRFDTIRTSSPRFEGDNIHLMTVKSPALNGRGDISVYIPEGQNHTDMPVAILLHGVYGSHWAWTKSIGVHHIADSLIKSGEIEPMILVMPSDGLWGDGSGYLPHQSINFEAWVVEDVIDAVTETFDSVSSVSKWFITGLSMGGFGSLRLGAKYNNAFSGIGGHSSITDFHQMELFLHEPKIESYQLISENDRSVIYWMKEHRSDLPPIRFDCGQEDLLIAHNRQLHNELLDVGINHAYEEFPGGHTTDYWELHISKSLRFFSSLV